MANQNRKVVRYRKPIHINLGVIVFFIIFLYITVISINYFRQDPIHIYEVTEKSISDDNTYKGIILRNETIYYTDKAGYVNYYVGDGDKIGKDDTIYTLDETGEIYQILSDEDKMNMVSKEDSAKVRNSISNFKKGYQSSDYSQVTDFRYNLDNIILEQTTSNLLSSLNDITSLSNRGSFQMVTAKKSGVVSYTIDGNEDLKAEDITIDTFKNIEEKRVQLRTSELVAPGSPVYKMLNNEDWSIIIPLSDEQYDKVKELEKVKILFKKDDVSAWVSISTYENKGSHFAKLGLSKYVVRYLNDRYIEIELMLNSARGLKIPVSSIVKSDFLLVPEDFITVGGKTNSNGVTKETYTEQGEPVYEFITVTVISKKDGEAYIDSDSLNPGDNLIQIDTKEHYQLGKTASLEGVYNVNSGYAVFRLIEKVYENKEYVIVSSNTPYGLSAYDHIVMNGESMKNSQLIKR